MSNFALDPAYKQVPERIADFRAKHPEGCLRPVDPERPFWVEFIGEQCFICYAAAAYRTADDPRPGIGVAWEPFPGRTPYTKDSEVMNAETSAWGRAIVAVLASESKAIASAEDVRNRQADAAEPGAEARVERHSRSISSGGGTSSTRVASEKQVGMVRARLKAKGYKNVLPDGWEEAGLPDIIDSSFPFTLVNEALAFIEALAEPA